MACWEIHCCQWEPRQRDQNWVLLFNSRSHLVIWSILEKIFPHQFLAFPKFHSTRGFKSINHFAQRFHLLRIQSLHQMIQQMSTWFPSMMIKFVIFKDGQGIICQVNYLGPHIIDKVLKHKICTEDDTYLLMSSFFHQLTHQTLALFQLPSNNMWPNFPS